MALAGLLNRRGVPLVFGVLWLIFSAQIIWPHFFPGNVITSPLRLFTFFYAGMFLYFYSKFIPLSWGWAIVAMVVLVVAALGGSFVLSRDAGIFYIVAPLPVAYLTLFAAARLPFQKINKKTDISYGIYIYGSIVMQCLTQVGWNALAVSYPVFLATCFLIILPLAFASWHFIEKPALKLKGRGQAGYFRKRSA